MYGLLIVLAICSVTNQALIGFQTIPEVKLPTLQKTDASFALTQTKISKVFKTECGFDLSGVVSVAYQIVGGIKYNMVFDSKYGPVNAIAITQYWEKSVDILELKLLEPESKNNTTKSSSPILNVPSNVRPLETAQLQFPNLKAKCELMKVELNKLQGDSIDGLETVSPLEQITKGDKKLALSQTPSPIIASTGTTATKSQTGEKVVEGKGTNSTNVGNSGFIIISKTQSKNSAAKI